MILRSVAVCLLALAVSSAAAEIRLTFSTAESPTSPSSRVFEDWAKKLSDETKGDLRIEFFYSQALSRLGDNLKAVSRGIADIAMVVPAYSPAQLPIAYLAETATGTGDQYVVTRAWQQVREEFPEIKAEEDRNNLVYLVPNSAGSVLFIGERVYETPADFKGETMRLSTSYAYAANQAKWNVNPARILSPETYMALEKGTISAATTYVTQIYPHKLNEVAKHVTLINQGQHTSMFYMNKDRWNGLSEANRAALERSLPGLARDLARSEIEASHETLSRLEGDPQYPMKIHRVSKDSQEVWADKLKLAYEYNIEKAAAVNPKASDIAVRYLQLIDEIEAEVSEKGYPWER